MNEDIFNSLLDVEQDASNMVFEAQMEADEKIEKEKKEIDKKYELFHNKIVAELDEGFVEQKKIIDDSAEKEITSYQDNLASIKPNFVAFNHILDDYFFFTGNIKDVRSNN